MYTVLYTNPNNVIRTEPYELKTRSKVAVRELLAKARQYPGSYEIVSITRETKARGVEHLSRADF